jgi:predicted MFS family arabinose efflux permease
MSGDQGAVAGLSSAAVGAGWVVAPLMGGVIYDAIGITAPFWIALAGALGMIAYAMLSKGLKAAVV